jgi:hypothetical protein
MVINYFVCHPSHEDRLKLVLHEDASGTDDSQMIAPPTIVSHQRAAIGTFACFTHREDMDKYLADLDAAAEIRSEQEVA